MKTIRLTIAFAVLLLVSHSVVEAADTTPPVIGAVTGKCGEICITITDDQAVDLKATTVVVLRGDTGFDITSYLTRINIGDGTAAGKICFRDVINTGSYILEIVAKDQANNQTPATGTAKRAVYLTLGDILRCPPCSGVDPTFGYPGETLNVVFTGNNTNFNNSSTVTFSYDKVKVNSQNATSPTSITANITIDAAAIPGAVSHVTVTTGVEEVFCSRSFTIEPPRMSVS